MTAPSKDVRRRAKRHKENHLAFETLEARMLMAVDILEANLQSLQSPTLFNSTPVISSTPIVGNAAPTVATSLRLASGTEVVERMARLTVLGADDRPEQELRYTWQAIQQPAGASVRFAASGTNSAKNNTLTFNRAGIYTIRVTIQDVSGALTTSSLRFNVKQTLSRLAISSPTNPAVNSITPTIVTGTNQRLNVRGLDQFGMTMTTTPAISWRTTSTPTTGSARLTVQSGGGALLFTRAGAYVGTIQSGNVTSTIRFDVRQTMTRAIAVATTNATLNTNARIGVTGTNYRLTARALDQFSQPMTVQSRFTWTRVSSPSGVLPTIASSGNQATLTFRQSGLHSFRATSRNVVLNASFNVTATLSRVQVTATTTRLNANATAQYHAAGLDQFGRRLPTQPRFTWSATGGQVSSTGLYRAGTTAGTFAVTARVGARSGVASIQVAAPTASTNLRDANLAALMQTYYTDQHLDRLEMIQLLRSAGDDGTVSAIELADLRFIVSPQSPYNMPAHVRELARDVVHSNPANATYLGTVAGNLAAGSSAVLLNKLVDKWFLGKDLPILTSNSLSYRNAVGNLFNTSPKLTDARQGALGDCYFIASLSSIASRNVNAIRNMFIDNGDNTFTVRFFGGALGYRSNNGLVTAGFVSGSGVADYITVNRSLPTYSNGMLTYSGSGLAASSTSAPLWIALAEKAYAQWNQTRNAGRDGTNRYASIEGGWMSNVNAQVLGYNSTNHSMTTSSKQTLINAVNSNNAVTIGTKSSGVSAGLVVGHAYTITGYNASTDRFTLHNPWGVSHPEPLTWAQLQANTTMFVVTSAAGSPSTSGGSVRGSATTLVVGNWTTVSTADPLASLRESDQGDGDFHHCVADATLCQIFVHDTADETSPKSAPIEFPSLAQTTLDGEQEFSAFAWQITPQILVEQYDFFVV